MISALPRPHPTFPTLALTPTAHTYPAKMRFLNCLRFYFSAGLIQILSHVYGVAVSDGVSKSENESGAEDDDQKKGGGCR